MLPGMPPFACGFDADIVVYPHVGTDHVRKDQTYQAREHSTDDNEQSSRSCDTLRSADMNLAHIGSMFRDTRASQKDEHGKEQEHI
jgi:hypothetical protein